VGQKGHSDSGGLCLFLWKRKWKLGHPVAQLVEALRYKPEGRGFDSRWCHWNFSFTMAMRLTQTLTEMSTRNISQWLKAAGAHGWQPYHLHVPTVLKSGSRNFQEPSESVQAYSGIALSFALPFVITSITPRLSEFAVFNQLTNFDETCHESHAFL